ncbi:MAG TPA: sigma-70 family RNA polymerase sigma factor [Vicinamibacteria bacterium]|jgi:RNA polymerase sigma-70 factor (ECF subfamily)
MQVVEPGKAARAAVPPLDTEALWLEFRGRVRAFVARRVAGSAEVDDIVQWVFLRLHRSLPGLREADRVHAWLYRTARRAIADYYRGRARNREVPAGGTADLEPLARDVDRDQGVEDRELHRAAACLAPLVDELPAPYREAILLADLQGVRLADAARTAGVSLSGMKSRVQRGRQRLRELLVDCCRIAVGRHGVTSCADHGARPPCGGSCA